MPYLRLYAQGLPAEQKRVVAQELIEITLRTFQLRADQRCQTSIQFITIPQPSGVDEPPAESPCEGGITLEVIGHNLTEEKKRTFAKEAAAMLASVTPVNRWIRIAGALGIKAKQPREICFLFNELSPAVSDPFIVQAQQCAA